MVSKVFTASLLGLEVQEITVETDYRQGLSSFSIVGLADRSVQESKERIISAIKNSDAEFVPKRLTVNLAPAPFHKTGASFDLAIAVGYLVSTEQLKFDTSQILFLGELGLEGKLRRVNGVFPILLEAKKLGYKQVFLPVENYPETTLVKGIKVLPVDNLNQLISHFRGKRIQPPKSDSGPHKNSSRKTSIFDEIQGNHRAKRAAEIIACGGHNLLLFGPPGSGKSMLASSLPEIMPQMSESEVHEVTKVYSASGLLPKSSAYIATRPFRSPHHSITRVAMLGGGNTPRLGEVSLAHKGVLFLDEFAEFHSGIRETLREPLETKEISISRANYKLLYPADFCLVAASNPCRCGYYGDNEIECRCTPKQVARYRSRISGPILDRIDIKLFLRRIDSKTLVSENHLKQRHTIRSRIEKARNLQIERSGDCNASISQKELRKVCGLGSKEKQLLQEAISKLVLSPRAYYRTLRVARTIADLEESSWVKDTHIAEALSFRLS